MTLEERIALGEDSTLELKALSIPGKRVVRPDAKDVADEFAAAELSERQFSRNELICTCLSRCPLKEDIPDVARTTIMDRRGEGVPVILGASRALSKKTPEYRLIDGCELKLTIRDARVMMNEHLYGRKVTEKVTEKPLEDRVLVAIAKNPNQAQREMAAWLGVNRAYLARVMSAMQKKGLIRRIGPDKGGHWEVVYA